MRLDLNFTGKRFLYMKLKKYFVVAKRWSDEKKEIIEYIAGEFDEYMNASIFRDAYNKHYSAHSRIVESTL